MPYLICNKCGGYYELKEGESPEDFEECECGGSLRQAESLNIPYNNERIKAIIETLKISKKSSDNLEGNQKLSINVDYTDGINRLLKEDKASKKDISAEMRKSTFRRVALIPELYNFDYIGPIDDDTKLQIIEILAETVYEGKGIIHATNEIASKTSISYEHAEIISKNEINRIKNLGNWYIHKENGYKYFKISKSLNACDACHKAYDNMIFSMDQVEMLPPLHSLCTCNAFFYKK